MPKCAHHEWIDPATGIGTCYKCGREKQYPIVQQKRGSVFSLVELSGIRVATGANDGNYAYLPAVSTEE